MSTDTSRAEAHFSGYWGWTRTGNLVTLAKVLRCFLPTSHADYTPCPRKPLILSGWWYTAVALTGGTSGEVIWQTSVIRQFRQLGYDFVSMGAYENWITVAEMMPDV